MAVKPDWSPGSVGGKGLEMVEVALKPRPAEIGTADEQNDQAAVVDN